jgi:hypothetical protein
MSADASETAGPDFGTQAIQPVAFRYPTAWLSWQAVLGDLSRTNPQARLQIEADGGEAATTWAAEMQWGPNRERVTGQPSLPDALLRLWGEVTAHHALYSGDLSKRGPALYEPHECLDVDSQAAIQRLLGVVRAAFGADWSVTLTYHPVAQADQRVHVSLRANEGAVVITATGATLIEGTRSLMRAAAPHFPKPKKER